MIQWEKLTKNIIRVDFYDIQGKKYTHGVKKVKGEYINIVHYFTRTINVELKSGTKNNQEITQKLHYWKVRHNLNTKHIDILKKYIKEDYHNFKIFINSYQKFIQKCRDIKCKIVDYQGDEFIDKFQEEIKEYYSKTAISHVSKNGYPIIK